MDALLLEFFGGCQIPVVRNLPFGHHGDNLLMPRSRSPRLPSSADEELMKAVFKTTGGKDPVKESSSNYSVGDLIFAQGDLGTDMFIIQEGEVDIIKHINGESHLLSHLERGDFFGEMALLESVPRTADALAKTDVKVLVINGSRFDDMLRKNPEIAVRIIRKYSKRLREANTLLERLVGRDFDADHAALDATQMTPPPKAAQHRLVDVSTGTAFFFSTADDRRIRQDHQALRDHHRPRRSGHRNPPGHRPHCR